MLADLYGALDAFFQGHPKADAEFFGDALRFTHVGGKLSWAGSSQMSTSVACVRALIGKLMLPHSFSQISDRMSFRIGAFKCAPTNASDTFPNTHAFAPIQFTDREAIAFEPLDDTRFNNLASRIDHASNDATRFDVLRSHHFGRPT